MKKILIKIKCVPEDYGKNIGDASFLDNKFGLNSTQISTFLQNLEKAR